MGAAAGTDERAFDLISVNGTKRTSQCAQLMSAFGGKADINERQANVCF